MDLHRRRVVLGIGAGLAAAPAAGQGRQGRTINGLGYIQTVVPPSVLQHMISGKEVARVTEPVIERSDAPQIREFRDYLNRVVAREPAVMRRLERVNLYVNHRVKGVADTTLYDRADQWAPPLNTLLVGGDCEDLALLKRWALLRVGFDNKDLFLVAGVTRAIDPPTFHAILGVALRPGNRIALLDNLSDTVQPSARAARFEPTYVLNPYGFWRIDNPNLADKAYWDQVSLDIQPKG